MAATKKTETTVDSTPSSNRKDASQIPIVASVGGVAPSQSRTLGEVAPIDVVLDTEQDSELFEAEYRRLLTKQLLRNLRTQAGLSLQDVAIRRDVERASIQTLENQDIATIKIGTLVKQLQAIGYPDFTETVLVKLILELLENRPDGGGVS